MCGEFEEHFACLSAPSLETSDITFHHIVPLDFLEQFHKEKDVRIEGAVKCGDKSKRFSQGQFIIPFYWHTNVLVRWQGVSHVSTLYASTQLLSKLYGYDR